jgi:NADH dehydrogenase FAD-containing subunit
LEETVGVATRVVIAGGGVAALEAALALRALAEDRLSVEMLAPEHHFWYRPLAVAEPSNLGEARQFELPELAAAAGTTFSLVRWVRKSIRQAARVYSLMRPPRRSRRWIQAGGLEVMSCRRAAGAGGFSSD